MVDSIKTYETTDSRNERNHPDWDPDWIRQRFTLTMKCANPNCNDPVVVTGHTMPMEVIDEEFVWDIEQGLMPEYFIPPVPIIDIPQNCSQDIKDPINSSFRLFWASPSSAANQLRSAIENLLTHKRIPRFTKPKNDRYRRSRLCLHSRLDKFKSANPAVANTLMAVKWLGNEGSHGRPLRPTDLLDGYELIEDALEQIFIGKSKKLEKMVEEINKNRGPRKPRKSKRMRKNAKCGTSYK